MSLMDKKTFHKPQRNLVSFSFTSSVFFLYFFYLTFPLNTSLHLQLFSRSCNLDFRKRLILQINNTLVHLKDFNLPIYWFETFIHYIYPSPSPVIPAFWNIIGIFCFSRPSSSTLFALFKAFASVLDSLVSPIPSS